MRTPLMPKATAVWLVENTSLTFDQIAAFCGLHPLEVKGIADGEVAQGIKGMDPIAAGQLSRAEIERGESDPSYRLKMMQPPVELSDHKRKGPRYTPLSKRQDRPNAILWLVRNHPELTDAQISDLVGTTKPTIQSIRDRTHWNMPNIKPQDPVTLGLCSQIDLDRAVQKAQERVRREKQKLEAEEAKKRADQLAAAEAAGLPSTRPVEEHVEEEPVEATADSEVE